ncbi:MAG: hypothetical protein ABI577_00145 [bacterium]
MSLRAKFDGDEMVAVRVATAKHVLSNWPKGAQTPNYVPDADHLVDHFDMLGFLLRQKVLDLEMVVVDMCSPITTYMATLDRYISDSRSEDFTIWQDAVALNQKMLQADAKARGLKTAALAVPDEDDMRKYMKEEAAHPNATKAVGTNRKPGT